MPGILILILIVIVVVLVVMFVRDSRRAQGTQTDPAHSPAPASAPAEPPRRQRPPLDEDDMEALAEHVRELRRAVDEGLIGREEAIASILRQADGRLGEQVAEQLLDGSELD